MPWKKMRLRGTEILARVDEAGQPTSANGRVEIRYSPASPRVYHAAVRNLEAIADAKLLPDEHCVSATEAAPSKASAGTAAVKTPVSNAESNSPLPTDAVVAYTDGACSGNPGPAGVGLIVLDGSKRIERSEYLGQGTNNIAELTGVLRALEAVEDPNRPMVIHTDSQYSIGVLCKGWKAKANQQLIAEVRSLLQLRPRARLVYVPGHAGVPLNERADELARMAVSTRKTVEKVYSQNRSAKSAAQP
jgi:ribonuclease HI